MTIGRRPLSLLHHRRRYPQGKSDAMKQAVETEETLQSFPAAGLRSQATYLFDEAAASKLSDKYRE